MRENRTNVCKINTCLGVDSVLINQIHETERKEEEGSRERSREEEDMKERKILEEETSAMPG